MSDAKAKDQGEQQHANMEARRLHAPDLQTVRLSGHVEMSRVEQDRTNASDGSLRHYQPTNLAGRKLPTDWHEQNRSLELQDGEISISRVNPLKEANLISRDKRNANGKPYQVYTAESSQAIQKPGEISKELTQGEYQSETKLSVQITNVPEVSSGLNPQYAVKYVSAAMDAGVVAVSVQETFCKSGQKGETSVNLSIARKKDNRWSYKMIAQNTSKGISWKYCQRAVWSA